MTELEGGAKAPAGTAAAGGGGGAAAAPRRRGAGWIALAALATGAVILVLVVRRGGEPLTAESLADARARWEAYGPPSYRLEVDMRGTLDDHRTIQVRRGEVVDMTTGGVAVPRSAWPYWTVEGLFDFLEAEVANAADPRQVYGVSDPSAIVIRARFDPELGYPVYFLRHVMGRQTDTEWEVVDFESTSGTAFAE